MSNPSSPSTSPRQLSSSPLGSSQKPSALPPVQHSYFSSDARMSNSFSSLSKSEPNFIHDQKLENFTEKAVRSAMPTAIVQRFSSSSENEYLGKRIETNLNSAYELERANKLSFFISQQKNTDQMRLEEARTHFDKKIGLERDIKEKVLPALVSIQLPDDEIGVGFFRHKTWIVSNAHVIRSRELLDSVSFFNCDRQDPSLTIYKSYHRKYDSNDHKVPDVVIINAITNSAGPMKCFPAFASDSENGYLDSEYLFYIDFNHDNPNESSIQYLVKTSKDGSYPMIYAHNDGSIPQKGSSGSPIVRARLSKGREPTWEFTVIGVLYGRCNTSEVSFEGAAPAANKLVCAIPIDQEFEKILEILNSNESAEREAKMGTAALSLKDSAIPAQQYFNQNALDEMKAAARFVSFENGTTELSIELPDGFEPLVGNKKQLIKEKEKEEGKFVHVGVTYYSHADEHGGKHMLPAKIPQKKIIDSTVNGSAKFNFADNNTYNEILKRVIRSFARNNDHEDDVRFFDIGYSIGWDEGQETQIVELYYNGETGSHIRPKSEDRIKKGSVIFDISKDEKI